MSALSCNGGLSLSLSVTMINDLRSLSGTSKNHNFSNHIGLNLHITKSATDPNVYILNKPLFYDIFEWASDAFLWFCMIHSAGKNLCRDIIMHLFTE